MNKLMISAGALVGLLSLTGAANAAVVTVSSFFYSNGTDGP